MARLDSGIYWWEDRHHDHLCHTSRHVAVATFYEETGINIENKGIIFYFLFLFSFLGVTFIDNEFLPLVIQVL